MFRLFQFGLTMCENFYCEYCNDTLVADKNGVYIHHETYHYQYAIYETTTGTIHVVPVERFDLRH
jgi:hypothetical protein